MADRDNYWDAIKGWSILAVVGIHALNLPGQMGERTFEFQFALLIRQFINFAVPMFLALAGYMAGGRAVIQPAEFVSSRLKRLLPPYLFWTLVYVGLGRPGDLMSPTILAADIFMGKGIGVGYFVIVLVQMVVLTPLISKVSSVSGHVIIMASGLLAGLATSYVFQMYLVDHPLSNFPANALPFWIWYPFYHLGFIARRYQFSESKLLQRRLPLLWCGWLLCVGLSWLEGQALTVADAAKFGMSQTKATSLLASGVLFVALLGASASLRKYPFTGSAWLGRNSYFMYLTHLLVFAVIAKIWARTGMDMNPVFYSILLLPLTVAVCAAGLFLAKRILPPAAQRVVTG